MVEPILRVEGVSKSYARRGLLARDATTARPALSPASFELMPGEILGIVGESGSGKTTLARCIALLERPDTGRVMFRGEDLVALNERELRKRRRAIQTVFQDPYASLNPRLKVGDALAEVMLVHRLAERRHVRGRVAELLDQVGLPSRAAHDYPAAFSGGQRQRICIARALAAQPDILIADEPVSSLDVSVQAQVVNLLLDLRDRLQLSVIFIGHDLHLIDFLAPRVIVMLAGEIVETVGGDVPITDARHPYTRALMDAVPSLEKVAARQSSTPESPSR
ncbi:MAG: Oligopeptide/dipeptide transporter, ATP-binding protein-like type [Devosia sp.]|uniref:ATP-binding cassette domain-containing protein n=1 Tax=Devosia sp. TaxID=1871048 RepID=UPI00261DB25D|nr:ABC transporter ATP-binding protein [Devosia sp.]MDB5542018.1 Oligopeptide/dipeptide transporter, ATP-binding protein-like type [Devosia sp.]